MSSRNPMTNHGRSFRLVRKGEETPGTGPATCKKADWALGSALLGLLIVPLVASIAGIALGVAALGEIRRDPELTGRNRAGWAIALGIVGLAWWLSFMVRRFG